MIASWDFVASNAQIQTVSAFNKHPQIHWSTSDHVLQAQGLLLVYYLDHDTDSKDIKIINSCFEMLQFTELFSPKKKKKFLTIWKSLMSLFFSSIIASHRPFCCIRRSCRSCGISLLLAWSHLFVISSKRSMPALASASNFSFLNGKKEQRKLKSSTITMIWLLRQAKEITHINSTEINYLSPICGSPQLTLLVHCNCPLAHLNIYRSVICSLPGTFKFKTWNMSYLSIPQVWHCVQVLAAKHHASLF